MPDRRLYAQFTLDYADSHKIAPLSDAAFRAHVRMILWSRRMLTDGKIPGPMARTFARPKVLGELLTNDAEAPSLTVDERGDYWVHDFLDHQSSREHVETIQATNRANGAKGGRAKAKRTATEPATEHGGEREADLYTESETETTTKTRSTRLVSETATSPDDDEGTRRRQAYWTGMGITNPGRIVGLLIQHVDRPISEDEAIGIVAGIRAKAKQEPASPQRYVEAAIRDSWAEIQRDLDEGRTAA